jgi:flagellar FliL protein
MSDKKSSNEVAPTAEAAPAKSGGLLRTVVIVFLLIGIAGIGYVLGGRGAAPAAPAAAAPADAAEPDKEEEEMGPVVEMDPININLAEGHYLRIAVALGLSADVKLEDPEAFDTAAASDVVLSTFSGMAMADLTSAEGREHAREMLLESLAEHYGEDVAHVYFTEFVMQ